MDDANVDIPSIADECVPFDGALASSFAANARTQVLSFATVSRGSPKSWRREKHEKNAWIDMRRDQTKDTNDGHAGFLFQ